MVIFKYTVSEKRNEFPAGQQPELEVDVFVPGEREFSQINTIH